MPETIKTLVQTAAIPALISGGCLLAAELKSDPAEAAGPTVSCRPSRTVVLKHTTFACQINGKNSAVDVKAGTVVDIPKGRFGAEFDQSIIHEPVKNNPDFGLFTLCDAPGLGAIDSNALANTTCFPEVQALEQPQTPTYAQIAYSQLTALKKLADSQYPKLHPDSCLVPVNDKTGLVQSIAAFEPQTSGFAKNENGDLEKVYCDNEGKLWHQHGDISLAIDALPLKAEPIHISDCSELTDKSEFTDICTQGQIVIFPQDGIFLAAPSDRQIQFGQSLETCDPENNSEGVMHDSPTAACFKGPDGKFHWTFPDPLEGFLTTLKINNTINGIYGERFINFVAKPGDTFAIIQTKFTSLEAPVEYSLDFLEVTENGKLEKPDFVDESPKRIILISSQDGFNVPGVPGGTVQEIISLLPSATRQQVLAFDLAIRTKFDPKYFADVAERTRWLEEITKKNAEQGRFDWDKLGENAPCGFALLFVCGGIISLLYLTQKGTYVQSGITDNGQSLSITGPETSRAAAMIDSIIGSLTRGYTRNSGKWEPIDIVLTAGGTKEVRRGAQK